MKHDAYLMSVSGTIADFVVQFRKVSDINNKLVLCLNIELSISMNWSQQTNTL